MSGYSGYNEYKGNGPKLGKHLHLGDVAQKLGVLHPKNSAHYLTETAIKERSNLIYFSRSAHTPERQSAFKHLCARKNDLHNLFYRILLYVLGLDVETVARLHEVAKTYFTGKLQDRVLTNATNVLTGLMVFCDATDAGWDLHKMAEAIEENLAENVLENGNFTKSEVTRVFEMLADMTELDGNDAFLPQVDFLYDSCEDTMTFRIPAAYQKVSAYAKSTSQPLIQLPDLRKQIKMNTQLLNKTATVWYPGLSKHKYSYVIRLSKLPANIADQFRVA